jgi:Aspartyl protease
MFILNYLTPKQFRMKYFTLIFLLYLLSFKSTAQGISFNQGETTQKDYFSIIKFENVGGFVVVKATIQGETYRFILDTGAPNSITKTLCDKLKPVVLSKEEMRDANGSSDSTEVVSIKEWTLGDVAFNNIPTAVIDGFKPFECMQVDGIIGSNMLRNSIIQFDYVNETLTLTDNATRLNLSEKYASNMELPNEQSRPFVNIVVRGETEGNDWVLFDTGFTGFYDLSLSAYDSVFSQYPIFNLKTTGFGGSGMSLWGFNEAKCHQLTVSNIVINGVSFHNVTTQTSTDDYSKIGHELLRYGKVTIDYPNKKFYFEPYNPSVDLAQKDFPISEKFEGNKLLIGTIWEKKFAQRIDVGDQIISIDGVNYETINPCDWILKGSVLNEKDRAQLVVKTKKGKTVDFEMERE